MPVADTAYEPFLPKPASYVPTHPGLFRIQFAEGDYNSCLKAEQAYTAGSVITPMTGTTPAAVPRYSSVQVAPYPPLVGGNEPAGWPAQAHIELNTDLLYVNHSCDPNVGFEVPRSGKADWKVRALKDIQQGEMLTFAYWTTEWDMDQPFDCNCATARCIGRVAGAKHIKADVLAAYPLNEHIALQKKIQLGLAEGDQLPERAE